MVSCVLCHRSEETKITGPLSTKEEVTAHQNCLLFSSGIFCRDSPEFDDLFGFSVEDVMDEVKRGSRLVCNKCKKKGATAGCGVGRCKKSYHYPCAVRDGAKTVEDADEGQYELYCEKHYQQRNGNNSGSVNGSDSSSTKGQTNANPSEAGPSKVYCLACEKTEGNISLESLSNSIMILYCNKHAPLSRKRNHSGDSTTAGPSACNSDSNSSSSSKPSSSKRRFNGSSNHTQEETPSKRKSEVLNGLITDDSSDENEPDTDMAIFAPLESDLEGSESQLNRGDTKTPTASTSANPPEVESKGANKEDDETDCESESLLILVKPDVVRRDSEGSSFEDSPVPAAGPSVRQKGSAGPPPSPDHSKPRSAAGSPPRTGALAISPAPPETISLVSSPASPPVLPSELGHAINSAVFWRSCNAAGCTQAIFTDFINGMNDVFGRIKSDRASQEDYDRALRVMEASGKLDELVTKQQNELQRKQTELQRAAEAMKGVVSALRR